MVVELDRDAEGRRRRRRYPVQGTREEADTELVRRLYELRTGYQLDSERVLLRDYLEWWLEGHARRRGLADRTAERYGEIIRRHITPALGHIPLDRLRPTRIDGYYRQAEVSGRLDNKGGLSRRTLLHHHRVLSEVLDRAVKLRLLHRNPCRAVDPPAPANYEAEVPTEAEAAGLLRASEGTRYFMPILLALSTGMRRGEILALSCRNVDLSSRRLVVRHSLQMTEVGPVPKEPKSRRGSRTTSLAPGVVDALEAHRTGQEEQKRLLGDLYADEGYFCARDDGRPWNPWAFSAAFGEFVRRDPTLPHVRFHDLRQAHATHLLRLNVHPKVVSERLGHSGIEIHPQHPLARPPRTAGAGGRAVGGGGTGGDRGGRVDRADPSRRAPVGHRFHRHGGRGGLRQGFSASGTPANRRRGRDSNPRGL